MTKVASSLHLLASRRRRRRSKVGTQPQQVFGFWLPLLFPTSSFFNNKGRHQQTFALLLESFLAKTVHSLPKKSFSCLSKIDKQLVMDRVWTRPENPLGFYYNIAIENTTIYKKKLGKNSAMQFLARRAFSKKKLKVAEPFCNLGFFLKVRLCVLGIFFSRNFF